MARVELHRAYKFRLYPTPAQVAELSECERQLRRLWNLSHEQRLMALGRHLRPAQPVECRSCGAVRAKGDDDDKTEHLATCAAHEEIARDKTWKRWTTQSECRSCGALKGADGKIEHTESCAFVDYYRQAPEMTELLQGGDDQLARVVCSARQEILRDLDRAWQRWRKAPQQWGKPRFKRRGDRCRIYFSNPKAWKVEAGSLSFAGAAASVGQIRIRQDRPWPGDAKFSSCHITRDGDEWYAVFPLVFSKEVVRPTGGAVGINRGAIHAIADSNGRVVDSPQFYARALGIIRHRARLFSRKVPFGHCVKPSPTKYRGFSPAVVDALARDLATSPGRVVYEAQKRGGLEAARTYLLANPPAPPRATLSIPSDGRNRERARQYLARAHQRVRRQREWFLHNESTHYARRFSTIAIEDWSTKGMTSSEPEGDEPRSVVRGRNRSILDVGWYEFGRQLKYKVEPTGGEFVPVDPGLMETETVVPAATTRERGADASLLKGEAGISRTCSSCGGLLPEAASGHREAESQLCLTTRLGDVNAAVNVLRRARRAPGDAPASAKKKRVTIGIKGRKKRAA